ncbi:hypothetical protein CYY_000380 [Polysphondylium violaceum]|uniref:EGF-like domain-containing protein n=1 Tax=Polysphondylium violaceum TaxID=133409 RepID=A0A8J4PZV0_9MYCE|nr:hypothetical protein CYY_000380 [Polysphondylium violaceum]
MAVRAGLSNQYPINPTYGRRDFCADDYNFTCSSDGNLGWGTLTSITKNVFDKSYFTCFKTNPIAFYCSNCNGITSISQPVASLGILWLETGPDTVSNLEGTVKLSYLKNTYDIRFDTLLNYDKMNLYFENDLQPSDNFSPFSFHVTASNIVNLTYATVSALEYTLDTNFDQDWSNIHTWTQVNGFWVWGSIATASTFPIEFSNMPIKSLLYTMSFSYIAFSVTSKVSISDNYDRLNEIYFYPGFNFNGDIPFSHIPPSVTKFTMTNGNYENITVDLFINHPNINTLNLANNNINGTLDNNICRVGTFALQSNQIGGELPSCITCHLSFKSLNNTLARNKFTNINNPPPCTTLTAYMRVDVATNRTYLYGTDLGFSNVYFKSTPTKDWKVDIPNQSFYIVGAIPQIYNLTFLYSNHTFLFSTLMPPNVTLISVDSKTITFNGTCFSNNKTEVSVVVGDVDCVVEYSDFNSIICSIPSSQWKNVTDMPTTINIGGMNTTVNVTMVRPEPRCNCQDRGECDLVTEQCKCYFDYQGPECYPQHYVTSVKESTVNGGDVFIYGNFSYYHNNPNVLIGNSECIIDELNSTTILCKSQPGTGIWDLVVNQNNLTWVGSNVYQFKPLTQQCPQNCNQHGECDQITGICICNDGWTGLDCNAGSFVNSETPGSRPPSVITIGVDGTGTINNEQTKFDILITALIEYTNKGEVVQVYDLKSKWSLNSTSNNTNVFKQKLENTNCVLTTTMEEIKQDKVLTFINQQVALLAGSIKISVDVQGYPYASSLNYIQLRIESIAGTLDNSQEPNPCNNDTTTIQTNSPVNNDQIQLDYMVMKKNSKVMYGRFINRVLSDGRESLLTTTVISKDSNSIVVGLNLPHCKSCLIDPDFSVLLDSDFKSKSQCANVATPNKKGYVIPVAVVVSVAGASIIGASAFLIYRKKFVEGQLQMKLKKLAQFNSSS